MKYGGAKGFAAGIKVATAIGKFKERLEEFVIYRSARWLSPRTSQDDPNCAMIEVDIDLKPEPLDELASIVVVLKQFLPNLNTDHPLFVYLGDQSQKGESAAVTLKLSVRPRFD